MPDKELAEKVKDFIEKADQMKKQDKMDLSSDQDLTLAIMHLISIEEHFIFTGVKTEKTDYYDLAKEVREARKELLQKVVKTSEGEVWCISKHLLGASMRLMEVGSKQFGMGNKQDACGFFKKAYDMYALFWGLNMDFISGDGIKGIDDTAMNKEDKKKDSLFGTMGKLVKKAINCCIE